MVMGSSFCCLGVSLPPELQRRSGSEKQPPKLIQAAWLQRTRQGPGVRQRPHWLARHWLPRRLAMRWRMEQEHTKLKDSVHF